MASESTKSELVRIRRLVPMTGKGVDNAVALIRKILESDRYTQKLVLEVGKPVLVETLVTKERAAEEIISFHDAVRNHPMVEYVPEGEVTPWRQLFEMFGHISEEKLEVSHVLVGDVARFSKWIKSPVRLEWVFGVPRVNVKEVPSDVFLVCGSSVRDTDATGIEMSVKGTLP